MEKLMLNIISESLIPQIYKIICLFGYMEIKIGQKPVTGIVFIYIIVIIVN